jgi:hypothetical protein
MVVALKKKSGNQNIGKNVAGVGTKIHVIMGRKDLIYVQITGANTSDGKAYCRDAFFTKSQGN